MKALVTTNTTSKTERVFLIGAQFSSRTAYEVQESLSELAELAKTAGGTVIDTGLQVLEKPHAATFIGSGKAEQFAVDCRSRNIDTVIFDDELSPAQSRNLEEIFKCKILDRTSLILDIFAQRAQTREGKLQVELAMLQHLLPRLTGYWTHLSRQKGGIGMRGGEGETQLEADRRKVQERIDRIRRELDLVQRQRSTRREGRRRNLWPLASIVGYTNAGKSTLFNSLTGAGILAEDKLFATLDPTTRRLRLPTNQNVLLSDTVGFIRKLPHQLVDSFKATLEEVVRADVLLHVVDISHSLAQEQIESVNQTLAEIKAHEKPTLMVLNKIDKPGCGLEVKRMQELYPHVVAISAKTREGFPELMAEIGSMLRPIRIACELKIPYTDSAVIARLHAVAQVVNANYENGSVGKFFVRIPPWLESEFKKYMDENQEDKETVSSLEDVPIKEIETEN